MSNTVEINGSMFTTHPINVEDFANNEPALKERFDMYRKQYKDAGKNLIDIRTYYNSGFNHVTQEQEEEREFGIEVEWIW
jgi:putative IMPACT (imprinted ancient) family translation regulator